MPLGRATFWMLKLGGIFASSIAVHAMDGKVTNRALFPIVYARSHPPDPLDPTMIYKYLFWRCCGRNRIRVKWSWSVLAGKVQGTNVGVLFYAFHREISPTTCSNPAPSFLSLKTHFREANEKNSLHMLPFLIS